MPCRCDDYEPTREQKDKREAAELICYVFTRNGQLSPAWARQAAVNEFGNHGGPKIDIVGFLCDHLRAMTPADLDVILYGDPRDRQARRLATWWENHLEDDKKRELLAKTQADAVARVVKLRASALSKLTAEERKALGLS